MTDRLRDRVSRALNQGSEGPTVEELEQAVSELRRRVSELEQEMQESRRLNRRLAELTDVVQELLVPIAERDEEKLRATLERYSDSL